MLDSLGGEEMNLNPIQFALIKIEPVRDGERIELTVTVRTLRQEVKVHRIFTTSDLYSMLDIVWEEMRYELDKQLGLARTKFR